MDRKRVVWAVIIVLFMVVIVQSSLLIYKGLVVSDPTAKATHTSVSMCINHPPVFGVNACNTTIRQSKYYSCQLNISDVDAEDTLSFLSQNLSGPFNFNISDEGIISAFPNDSMVGSSEILFTVQDDSGCLNDIVSSEFTFTVADINDPPVFVPPMGPFEWALGNGYRGVFLNAYFFDPDDDPLTFSHSSVPSWFLLTVTETNELIFSASSCGEGSMVFTATDPYNLSASSTPVQLNVPCPSQGGGGGGGASERCTPDWYCDDWSDCYKNGTQQKVCADHAECEDEDLIVWRNCTYIPHCENGILDGNELGVDCGGSCSACPSCEDGIKNQGELGVDCGGPCSTCMNCFDGIQNFGELGVDCGGPCPACPSCFDGIQNQNETGVDCGGPCQVCKTIDVPAPVKPERSDTMLYVLGGLGVLVALAIIFRVFHRQISMFLAKFLLFFTRRHKKELLLTPIQRDDLLDHIAHLEHEELLLHPTKKSKALFQSELAVIIRKLFIFLIGHSVIVSDVDKKLDALSTTHLVKHILKKQYTLLLALEQNPHLHVSAIKLHLEVLRERIFDLSDVSRVHIAREVNRLDEGDHSIDEMNGILHNLFLALQFGQVSVAKKKYLQALKVYDVLTVHEQSEVFTALHLAFDNIRYVSTFTRKK